MYTTADTFINFRLTIGGHYGFTRITSIVSLVCYSWDALSVSAFLINKFVWWTGPSLGIESLWFSVCRLLIFLLICTAVLSVVNHRFHALHISIILGPSLRWVTLTYWKRILSLVDLIGADMWSVVMFWLAEFLRWALVQWHSIIEVSLCI